MYHTFLFLEDFNLRALPLLAGKKWLSPATSDKGSRPCLNPASPPSPPTTSNRRRPDRTAAAVFVVDLRRPAGDLAPEIGRACREWGAFQVVGHGVPPHAGRRAGLLLFAGGGEVEVRLRCGRHGVGGVRNPECWRRRMGS